MVAEVITQQGLKLNFRRQIVGIYLEEWRELLSKFRDLIRLTTDHDQLVYIRGDGVLMLNFLLINVIHG